MNAEKIIECTRGAGMRMEVQGEKLMVYNTDRLTDELRQEIRLHKPEIIRLLSANDDRLTDQEIADLLREACSGIEIDVQQFWAFLDESDIVDIRMGAIPLENLKAFAKSWVRYPELVPIGNRRPFPALNEVRPVCSADCSHFTRDTLGNGTGIGKCAVNAPTTTPRYPRYPKTERYCTEFKSQQEGVQYSVSDKLTTNALRLLAT